MVEIKAHGYHYERRWERVISIPETGYIAEDRNPMFDRIDIATSLPTVMDVSGYTTVELKKRNMVAGSHTYLWLMWIPKRHEWISLTHVHGTNNCQIFYGPSKLASHYQQAIRKAYQYNGPVEKMSPSLLEKIADGDQK